MNCDQLSSAQLQATIIKFEIFLRVSRSVLLKLNQTKLDAIFFRRMMLSVRIDIVFYLLNGSINQRKATIVFFSSEHCKLTSISAI